MPQQGLDLRKVYEVITGSAGNSWMFENRIPHVLDGDYAPRSAIDIFVKDLGIVQDMAREWRFPVPLAAAALQVFLMASGAGMGRDDDASVARIYARLTGTVPDHELVWVDAGGVWRAPPGDATHRTRLADPPLRG